MGNICVGPSISKNGFFQSLSATLWRSRSPDKNSNDNTIANTSSSHNGSAKDESTSKTREAQPFTTPPQPMKIEVPDNVPPQPMSIPPPSKPEPQPTPVPEPQPTPVQKPKPTSEHEPQLKPKSDQKPELIPGQKPEPIIVPKQDDDHKQQKEQQKQHPDETTPNKTHHSRISSVGLQVESVLNRNTGNLKEIYSLGRKLGQGQFGTTYLCVEKATGKEFACKSIAKRKLATEEDVEDVRREIQIMHHLAGHSNVISIIGAYEDAVAVHVVMELCAGGELFDRIIQRGHYTERKAADLSRVIVAVVETCHSLGVMHRDLKPENFLFVNQNEDASLKTIDFGLSMFFKPGEIFSDVVGSPYYVAPEVLRKRYSQEADVWSAGVIIYILLCGVPPFWAESEQGIFEQVLHGTLDFHSDPWPSISDGAKDLLRKMLVRDPKKRISAHEVLCHSWIQADGEAPDKPLDSAVLTRLKHFSAMNKLKKMALRVIAQSLSEEEIAGLKEMFKMIDTDNSGQITYEELKVGLERVGAKLNESEIYSLMQAADVDNSGTIDYPEFIAATMHLNKIEREDHLFRAFSYFDKDGSGYITQDELQKACEEFGLEDVKLDEIIQEVDQDNDGRIDYNEFVAMMQQGSQVVVGGKKGLQNSLSTGFRDALKLG